MTKRRHWMLFVPEIEPAGFVFFFFRGETGRSYSLRRYHDAFGPPKLLTQNDLPYRAEEILALATHQVVAKGHPVVDVAHWREITVDLDRNYLGGKLDRPDAPAAAREVTRASEVPAPLHPPGDDPKTGGDRFFSNDSQPLRNMGDWRAQHPSRHWREGYSAMELARCWSEADGFPSSFQQSLDCSKIGGLMLERGVVEHKTPVPGRGLPSCTDLMVFARSATGEQVVVGVEGKVDEVFGPRVGEWLEAGATEAHRENRETRLSGLCDALGFVPPDVLNVRYQLLHRAYAALETAREVGAQSAVLAIHSLEGRGPYGGNWEDFREFVLALGCQDFTAGEPCRVGTRHGVEMWLMWITEGVFEGQIVRPVHDVGERGEVGGDVSKPSSIFSGVDSFIDAFFGIEDVGSAPHHTHQTSARQLSGEGGLAFDAGSFSSGLYSLVERNGLSSTRAPSQKNWRLQKMPTISANNRSLEKRLEKAIVQDLGEEWTNQMPTASGLVTSGERQRNIDLVHLRDVREFELIELKVGSDTPLFAAIEILKNGITYLFSRRHREELGYRESDQAPLWADVIHLRVLAPAEYFHGYNFGWLKRLLNRSLAALVDPTLDGSLHIDFCFERFSRSFKPEVRGANLVREMANREAVW